MNERNIKMLISCIEGEENEEKKRYALNIIESVARCFGDVSIKHPNEDSETNSICGIQSVEELIYKKILKCIKKKRL